MLAKISANKGVRKVIALILIITMTLANLMFLGKNLISYAFNTNIEAQGSLTQSSNVNFDAYFTGDGGDISHSVIFDCLKDEPKINLNLSVKNTGYLKEAYIDFRDEASNQDINYKILGEISDTTLVQNINTTLNTLTLNRIENGTEAVIEIPITMDIKEMMNVDKLKQDTLVTLRGIYVGENGAQVEILKTIRLNLGWTIKDDIVLEQAITKYVPTNDGILIQTKATLKQSNEDIALPVKSTELTVKVPEISETMPEKIVVTTDKTDATNGNKIEFTAENWKLDEDEKTITINVNGYENENLIWAGRETDEYYITYTYPVSVYSNEITLHCDMEAKMQLCSGEGIIEKSTTSVGDVTLTEKVGDTVLYSIDALEDKISKGKMYANYNSDTKTYDTEYNSQVTVNISEFEKIDGLYIDLQSDDFVGEQNTYSANIGGVNYAVYRKVTFDKSNIQKILGEDGMLKIYADDNMIDINKETADVDGMYVLDFEIPVRQLKIQTSKPIADGTIKIDIVNEISKDLPYEKDQVKEFSKIKLNALGYVKFTSEPTYTETKPVFDTIDLTETQTNAELMINNTTFSSMVENKNVEFKIVLNNNEENSDLYKNPVFIINLPKYIENIEITGGNILYSDALEIDRLEREDTVDGIVLTLYTKGAESTFSDGVFTNGTNIILNTNIIINKDAPNYKDKIVMTYANESAISYVNKLIEKDIVITAPEEIKTYNSVLTSGIEAISQDGNEQAAKLEILSSSKIATVKITMLNKYADACSNVTILGRTPFKGNKSIETGEDLGSTFDAKLIGGIDTNDINAEVYYSENENATRDLQDEQNGWTRNLMELINVKSYLIVLDDYEIKPGEKVEFTYNCEIPENLEHNESTFESYVVYFDNIPEYLTDESTEGPKVGLTTGDGANLKISTKVMLDDKELTETDIVKEHQVITYRTTIQNTSEFDAENLHYSFNVENGTIVKKGTLDPLYAGKEVVVEYQVEVNEYNSQSQALVANIKVTADNFEGELEESFTNNIEEPEVRVTLGHNCSDILNVGDKVELKVRIDNFTKNNYQNLKLVSTIPSGLEFSDKNSSDVKFNKETRELTIDVDSLESEDTNFNIVVFKTICADNIGENNIDLSFKCILENGKEFESNIDEITVISPVLDMSLTSSLTSGSYVKEGQNIDFVFTVKNNGGTTASSMVAGVQLVKELNITSATYSIDGGTEKTINNTSNNLAKVSIDLSPESMLTIKLSTKAKTYGNVDRTVSVNAYTSSEFTEKVTTDELIYTIETSNTGSNPGGNNPVTPKDPKVSTYKISGIAWVDENEDGQKQNKEKLLANVNVLLIDATTRSIVRDITNNTNKETKTDANGKYTFSNIPKGQYIVVFEYDSGRYNVTEYNKQGVSEDLTSKAIQSQINKDGTLKYAGITNTISVTDSSIGNINIGLVEKAKFDLSLNMQLGAVTIANTSGTNIYTFDNNPKLGKIDIQGKYLNSSTATIQYKIIVKNEGAIEGYAKKIIDYKPSDMIFDSSMNPGWYLGSDGYIYNNSLANTIIKPGESKEISLLLVKKITEDNIAGIITNTVEIYETSNEYGFEDYNSTPANRSQSENDYSYADLIITVRTGQILIYIIISIISVAIIATGVYLINKKVLKGGRF